MRQIINYIDMYKTVNFLFVLFLSVFLFTSCEKEPILEVSQSSLTFIDQGGTQSISFSTNKDWTASVSGGTGWCTITPASGNSDIKTISVTTVANTTYDDRTATITINAEELSKVITITQPKNRAIILTKDSYEVGTSGGNISVELNSNIEYDVTIPTENQTWITNTTTKGLITSTLTFAIASNETYDSRKGKIIIKDKTTTLADTVNITQAQKNAIILTQKTFNVADTLIVVSVELKSNTSYLVTIPSAAQLWIKQLQTKALKTESLQFEVARNTAFQARSAEIILLKSLTTLTDTLVINQAKAPFVPTLSTYEASNITASSISTGGNINSDGGGEVLARGVCWSKSENPTIEDSKTSSGKGTGVFTTEITGLEPGTKYNIRSYATNRTGTGYGNAATFTTLITKPTVTTSAASQVTKNSAVLGGNIISTGGDIIYNKGVIVRMKDNLTGKQKSSSSESNPFSVLVDNLLPNTTYIAKAVAGNSEGESYGEEIEFTTLKGEPIVEIQKLTLISQNSLEIEYLISKDGGSEVTESGVCWNTTGNPSVLDSKKIVGTGIGTFTTRITLDQPISDYYFKAYAVNNIGISYGLSLTKVLFGEPISDIDGNTYNTVKIGTQSWMAENLKTTRYRNGDDIGTTMPATLDITGEFGAKYQWAYNGDESNVKVYGRLYTWHAASDSRGICPTGWHIPTSDEWKILFEYLGGINVAGSKLKEIGSSHWLNFHKFSTATNSSGFTALPGGYRAYFGRFSALGVNGFWLNSDRINSMLYVMYDQSEGVGTFLMSTRTGFSVRCVKD